jgi:hypothetical protein
MAQFFPHSEDFRSNPRAAGLGLEPFSSYGDGFLRHLMGEFSTG